MQSAADLVPHESAQPVGVADNLFASLIHAPLAPLGVSLGVWLHNNISDRYFFRVVYLLLFVVALKLISDGITGW